MINKMFTIDLTNLYEHIGDNTTKHGYTIEHDEQDGYNDLYLPSIHMYALDGETCEVVSVNGDDVAVRVCDYPYAMQFTLSMGEFKIVCSDWKNVVDM